MKKTMYALIVAFSMALPLSALPVFAQTCPENSFTVEQIKATAPDINAKLIDEWTETSPARSIKALREQLTRDGGTPENIEKIEHVLVYSIPSYPDAFYIFTFNSGCSIRGVFVSEESYKRFVLEIERRQAGTNG